jgi:hypothetical protein
MADVQAVAAARRQALKDNASSSSGLHAVARRTGLEYAIDVHLANARRSRET